MRFVIADPNSTAGKDVDRGLRNEIGDTFAQWKPLNLVVLSRVLVLAVVFDQKLQSFPVADAGYFIKATIFCFKCLIVDCCKLGRQGQNVVLKHLWGEERWSTVVKVGRHNGTKRIVVYKMGDKGTETMRTYVKNGKVPRAGVVRIPFIFYMAGRNRIVAKRTVVRFVVENRIMKFILKARLDLTFHQISHLSSQMYVTRVSRGQ